MGHAIVPIDEALAMVAVDFGGRGYFVFDGQFSSARIGQVGTSLIPHFLESVAHEGRLNLHVRLLAGTDDHHRAVDGHHRVSVAGTLGWPTVQADVIKLPKLKLQ